MKIAVVTGASSQIGKEFVIEISKHFSDIKEIWVIGKNEVMLYNLKKFVHNKRIVVIPLDLTVEENYEYYKNLLKQKIPRIKMLINCASSAKYMNFVKSSYIEQIKMIDLNCKALVALIKISVPYMYYGSYVINLASSTAYIPIPKLAVYSATKSMVLSFSRALNRELKQKGIKVTAVCHRPILEEFLDLKYNNKNNWVLNRVLTSQPKDVVKLSMKAAKRGREVALNNVFKPLVALSKIIPHSIFLKLFK